MRAVCVVASILAGASAEIGGCVLDPSGPNACHQGISLADSASLLQVKATERVQDESKAAALTQTAVVTQRCSDSPDGGCEFTEWSAWSGCSKTCGTGTQTRTRETKDPEKCKVVCLKESETCNVDPCTTTPEPTQKPSDDQDVTKMCHMYGDPHFIAFDGHKEEGNTATISEDGVGVLWVVKSDEVKIQADCSQKSLGSGTGTGWGRSTGLAAAGSALGDRKLVFLRDGKKTLLDGEEIVKNNETNYKSPDGLIEVWHFGMLAPNEEEWKNEGFDSAEDFDKVNGTETWIWRLGGKKINMYFSLADSIDVIIRMPKVEGMDGLCGNFDDLRANDIEMPYPAGQPMEISKRMKIVVGQDDPTNLFITGGQSFLQESDRVVSGRTMEDCEPELKKKADEECAKISLATFREACVYDICKTGDLQDAADEFEMEVLDTIAKKEQKDKVNTEGQ